MMKLILRGQIHFQNIFLNSKLKKKINDRAGKQFLYLARHTFPSIRKKNFN